MANKEHIPSGLLRDQLSWLAKQPADELTQSFCHLRGELVANIYLFAECSHLYVLWQ